MARDRDGHRGTAHKVASVILRLGELVCAVIVIGILSRFCYLLSLQLASANSRVVYAMVVAGITIIYAFFLCAPFDALFMSFPCDFILFIMWLVAFCLLEVETGSNACNSGWYNNYWGYYWGRYWRVGPPGTVVVSNNGCGYWRSVLAFSFIACICHLLSGILGVYVFRKYVIIKETAASVKRQAKKISSRKPQTEGSGFAQTRDEEAAVGTTTTTQPPRETVGGTPY
jgi:hypothetical protein